MHNTQKSIFFILSMLFSFVVYGQSGTQELSRAQKVEDFKYLYNELKAAYPYFGINKRVYDTDWLANKKAYTKIIKKTKDNKAFFKAINDILNDLHNGHTDAYPTIIYDYFYEAYQYGVTQDPTYKIYVEELEKTDSIRAQYWAAINHELFFAKEEEELSSEEHQEEEISNVKTLFIDSLSVASVHIRSFSYDYVEEDANELQHFLAKASRYQNLIIDIQGNDGGSTEYWMQNIVAHLIERPMSYPLVFGFKNCDRLRAFKPSYFENTIDFNAIDLPNMPLELQDGSYLFRRDSVTISPSIVGQQYEGHIYLLVDDVVYSSAEALAYFCKATQFATVVGERTSGDGVGTDPLLLTLPNSGIAIRFTGEMGLNPDGSANDETQTIPDIKIEAANANERQEKLINYIQQQR